jgi:hypothetical protein
LTKKIKKHSNTLKWKCIIPDIRKKLVKHIRLKPNKLREPCNTGRERHIYLQGPRVNLEIKHSATSEIQSQDSIVSIVTGQTEV